MPLSECPDCEKSFVGERCECGYRKPRPKAEAQQPWQMPEWMQRPPPCTPDENYRAVQLVTAVLGREITVEQGEACLAALFRGRE